MSQHTILFVDDEANVLSALQRLFRKTPYHILTANNGSAALDLIKGGEKPSVIVSDQHMPVMKGVEFLARAKDLLPDTSLIILTGFLELESAIDAINKGGVSQYITKPWNEQGLLNTIDEAINRYELICRNKELTEELKEKNGVLEEWNVRLEEKVAERTQTLHETQKQLQLKVKELEGRDRILQHILEVHALDETLELVLEVIGDLVDVDEAVVYLGASLDVLKARLRLKNGQWTKKMDLVTLTDRVFHRQIFKDVISLKASRVVEDGQDAYGGDPFAVVPILKGASLLGLIEIASSRSEKGLTKSDIEIIENFGRQAAIAINDSLLQTDLISLDSTLEDVLNDL